MFKRLKNFTISVYQNYFEIAACLGASLIIILAIFMDYILGPDNYCRLTVKPGIWIAFMGISERNLLTNIANLEHDPNEVNTQNLDEIDYDWS